MNQWLEFVVLLVSKGLPTLQDEVYILPAAFAGSLLQEHRALLSCSIQTAVTVASCACHSDSGFL